MAKLSDLSTDLFGAIGVYDPEVLKTGIAIKRVVDFEISPIGSSKNYEFLKIPSGFVMTGVYVEELEKCASGTLTLKTVEDPTKTIGAAVTVGGDTLAKQMLDPVASVKAKDEAGTGTVAVPGAPLKFLAADMLCIKASAAMATGKVAVVLHGYLMDGGSLNADALEVPYRNGQTAGDYAKNKSSGDLYLQKVAAHNPAAQ